MRLTCPNCSARYEVDDSLVPPEGRDVQCSNCATTWFQPGNRFQMEELDTADATEQAEAESSAMGEATDTPTGPVRRELDPAIKDLLREEREREEDLRRGGDADPIESQEEMALDRPSQVEPETEPAEEDDETETLAALRSAAATDTEDGETSTRAGRRDLLPDIEEINSTLRATTDRNAQDLDTSDIDTMDVIPRRRRGFRVGFLLMLVLVGVAVLAYAYTDKITAALPQAEAPLAQYVEQVDGLRLWLDGMVQNLAERLSNSTADDG